MQIISLNIYKLFAVLITLQICCHNSEIVVESLDDSANHTGARARAHTHQCIQKTDYPQNTPNWKFAVFINMLERFYK